MGIRPLAVLLGLAVALPVCAGTVSGRVADSNGNPVDGARVVWYAFRQPERALLERTLGIARTPLGDSKTDASGSFKVTFDKPAEGISLEISSAGLPSVALEGPYDPADESLDIECLLPDSAKLAGRIVDESNKPLSGARIRAALEPEAAEGEGSPFAEAVSQPDGSFQLRNAPRGAGLLVELPGFAASNAFESLPSSSLTIVLKAGGSINGTVVDSSGKPQAGVTVVSGAAASETDEQGRYRIPNVAIGAAIVLATAKGDLVARRDGVLIRRGQVTQVDLSLSRSAVISGSVIDANTQRPVSGAIVTLGENRPWASLSGRTTRTDTKGRFRVAGLVPRTLWVIARHRDYLSSAPLAVRAATSVPASIALALRKAVSLSGRVVDEKNSPVPRTRVSVLAAPMGRRALLRGISKAPATYSLADGSFHLRGVSPDLAVSIEARKDGFAPTRRHGLSSGAGEGAAKPITLIMRRGQEARGLVTDSQGLAVAGVELRLQRRERSERPGSFSIQTDSDERTAPAAISDSLGRLSVSGLDAGRYTGRLSHEGFADKTIPLLSVLPDGVTTWPPIVLDSSAPIAGIVRNRKGEPVAGAEIFSFANERTASTTTDPMGSFRLNGYSSGKSVAVYVSADSYARTQVSATAPAESLSIVLSNTGDVRGRAEDAETKAPLEDFSVRAGSPRTRSIRYSYGSEYHSPDGSFTIPSVPPGKIEITASASGYLDTAVTGIEIAEGESKEGIVLSMKRGRDLVGHVVDSSRETGIANATVSWRREQDPPNEGMVSGTAGTFIYFPNSVTTEADGRFHCEGLPPERLVFSAFQPDYREGSKTVDVSSESTIEVALGAGGAVTGTVVDHDGRTPVVGADVSLEELGASSMAWRSDASTSDGSGRFRFEHMKEGRFRLTAQSESGRSPAREVVLGQDQPSEDVLLQFSSGATVRGRVSGLPAGRLGGLTVSGFSRDFQGRASTSDDGTFVLDDVPAGALRVTATTGFPGRSVTKNADVPEGAAEVPIEIPFESGSKLTGRLLRGETGVPGVFFSVTPDPPIASLARVSGQTDTDGRYELEGLPDASYRLQFSSGGVNAFRRVTVAGDTSFDTILGSAGLSGVVTDAASGEPLADVRLRAEKGADSSGLSAPSALTDSKGYYVIGDLDSGTYQVTAQRPGYQQKAQSVAIGDSSTEVNVALSRGGGLVVTAMDGATGLPLRGLDMAASSSGGPVLQGSIQLDAAGRGETPALPPGSYTLQFFSAGYAPRILSPVDVPGQPLVVAMTMGGRLEIRTDVPATVKVLTAAGVLALRSPWSPDGTGIVGPPVSVFGTLETGSYVLVVTAPGPARTLPFRVTEGQTTTLTIGP
jgi:5-hydroxyisourate hydrolase-like protein (transthyretin family)